jgi:hypothetical protein
VKRTRIEFTCDLHDGEVGANTHTMAIDDVAAQVDLCGRGEAQLAKVLGPYVAAATRIGPGGRIMRRPAGAASRTHVPMKVDAKAVRDWWRRHPKDLPPWRANGALPTAVVDAYRAATAAVAADVRVPAARHSPVDAPAAKFSG